MINWTTDYIISQGLIIIVYALLISTYFFKDRMKILNTNVVAHILQAISFFLLSGFSGVIMNMFLIFRDSFIAIDSKKNKSKSINNKDIFVLVLFILIIIVMSVFTYNGWMSLLPNIATIISTIAIWQKKTKIYKGLGIPISLCWLGYNIFLKSIFAIILESLLLVSTIIGYSLDKNKK